MIPHGLQSLQPQQITALRTQQAGHLTPCLTRAQLDCQGAEDNTRTRRPIGAANTDAER